MSHGVDEPLVVRRECESEDRFLARRLSTWAELEAAARWPERVHGLVAVNTFGWPRGVAFTGMLRVMGSAPMRAFDTATGFLPDGASGSTTSTRCAFPAATTSR